MSVICPHMPRVCFLQKLHHRLRLFKEQMKITGVIWANQICSIFKQKRYHEV